MRAAAVVADVALGAAARGYAASSVGAAADIDAAGGPPFGALRSAQPTLATSSSKASAAKAHRPRG